MQREQLLEMANAYNTTLIDVGAGPLAVVAAEQFGCDVVCVDIDFEKVRLATEDARETGLAERLLYCVADGARRNSTLERRRTGCASTSPADTSHAEHHWRHW